MCALVFINAMAKFKLNVLTKKYFNNLELTDFTGSNCSFQKILRCFFNANVFGKLVSKIMFQTSFRYESISSILREYLQSSLINLISNCCLKGSVLFLNTNATLKNSLTV